VGVSDSSAELDQLVPGWLTVPEVAERLGVDVTRVRQLLKDRQLAAVRRGPNDALHVPAAFVAEGAVLKGLAGTLTVLHDAGYSDVEAVRWLFSPDEWFPGSPVLALRENRKTEVRRRAQALAF
jgi:excisionase family DNA binding protein